ncbi:MAG: PDZ domain-containing protein [Gemmatimonadaceae bacterium]|nr:PDZ domain-containing protein [Gemmatimonadaceae bacterium]
MRIDPHSPAAAAGLQVGDTVEAINGQELSGVPLPELLRYKAGQVVSLRVRRAGKSLVVRATTVQRTPELEARLGARPPSRRP